MHGSSDRDYSLGEIGQSGLYRVSGWVQADSLNELNSWPRACQIYTEMAMNSTTVGALLYAVQSLCRSVKWDVVPASQKPEDKEAAEFVESCFNDMEHPFRDILDNALTMLSFGFSLCEVVYKQRLGINEDPKINSKFNDGRVGIRKIAPRAQNTLFLWLFAEAGSQKGDVIAFRQSAAPDYNLVDIPISKCLLFRTDTTANNPQGRSILRNAVRSYRFLVNLESLEGIGTERNATGLPMVKIPAAIMTGKDAESVAANRSYEQMAVDVRRDSREGVVLPSEVWKDTTVKQYDLELLSTGGLGHFDLNNIIRRYNLNILSTVLSDVVMLGHGGGSQAMATSKQNVFLLAVKAFLDIIAAEINKNLIPKLLILNPDLKGKSPKLVHSDLAGTDLRLLGNFIKALKFANVPIENTKEMQNHFMKVAGLLVN